MKLWTSLGILFVTSCLSYSTYAAESVAKEEITPPPPYEAISADNVPPITNLPKTTLPHATPPTMNRDTSPASKPTSPQSRVDKLLQHRPRNFF